MRCPYCHKTISLRTHDVIDLTLEVDGEEWSVEVVCPLCQDEFCMSFNPTGVTTAVQDA